MTEGLIILVNEDKIEKALWVNSDAYFSWLGIRLLEKFKDNSLKDFILKYNNTKYNKMYKRTREFYNAKEEDMEKIKEEILKLTEKIEYRTYTIKGANKYEYLDFLKCLPYVPSHLYIYDYNNEELNVKGYDEKYIINKLNVNEYIEKFKEE